MEYFVYVLYSEDYNRFYIGYTSNLEQRLIMHNSDENTNSFTSKYKPWTLVLSCPVGTNKTLALKIERKIKNLKSKKLLTSWMDNPPDFNNYILKLLSSDLESAPEDIRD